MAVAARRKPFPSPFNAGAGAQLERRTLPHHAAAEESLPVRLGPTLDPQAVIALQRTVGN